MNALMISTPSRSPRFVSGERPRSSSRHRRVSRSSHSSQRKEAVVTPLRKIVGCHGARNYGARATELLALSCLGGSASPVLGVAVRVRDEPVHVAGPKQARGAFDVRRDFVPVTLQVLLPSLDQDLVGRLALERGDCLRPVQDFVGDAGYGRWHGVPSSVAIAAKVTTS